MTYKIFVALRLAAHCQTMQEVSNFTQQYLKLMVHAEMEFAPIDISLPDGRTYRIKETSSPELFSEYVNHITLEELAIMEIGRKPYIESKDMA